MTHKQFRTFVHRAIANGSNLQYRSRKAFDNLRPWNEVFTTRLYPDGTVEVEFLSDASRQKALLALQKVAGIEVTGRGMLFVKQAA